MLSPDILKSLHARARDHFRVVQLIDEHGKPINNSMRISDTAALKLSDPLVRNMVDRLVKLIGFPSADYAEPPEVNRYNVSGMLALHRDYLNENAIREQNHAFAGCQRVATVVVYLVSPQRGGETVLVSNTTARAPIRELDVSHPDVKLYPGKEGRVITWFNVHPLTEDTDNRTWHGGMVVEEGVKVALSFYIRNCSRIHNQSLRRKMNTFMAHNPSPSISIGPSDFAAPDQTSGESMTILPGAVGEVAEIEDDERDGDDESDRPVQDDDEDAADDDGDVADEDEDVAGDDAPMEGEADEEDMVDDEEWADGTPPPGEKWIEVDDEGNEISHDGKEEIEDDESDIEMNPSGNLEELEGEASHIAGGVKLNVDLGMGEPDAVELPGEERKDEPSVVVDRANPVDILPDDVIGDEDSPAGDDESPMGGDESLVRDEEKSKGDLDTVDRNGEPSGIAESPNPVDHNSGGIRGDDESRVRDNAESIVDVDEVDQKGKPSAVVKSPNSVDYSSDDVIGDDELPVQDGGEADGKSEMDEDLDVELSGEEVDHEARFVESPKSVDERTELADDNVRKDADENDKDVDSELPNEGQTGGVPLAVESQKSVDDHLDDKGRSKADGDTGTSEEGVGSVLVEADIDLKKVSEEANQEEGQTALHNERTASSDGDEVTTKHDTGSVQGGNSDDNALGAVEELDMREDSVKVGDSEQTEGRVEQEQDDDVANSAEEEREITGEPIELVGDEEEMRMEEMKKADGRKEVSSCARGGRCDERIEAAAEGVVGR